MLGKLIAHLVHSQLPDITSLTPERAKRISKNNLDYIRNGRGQAVAAPYCARPYPGATVSAPLKWAEVRRGLEPSKFTIKSMPKRLEKVGDLWEPVLGEGIELGKCLEKLAKECD